MTKLSLVLLGLLAACKMNTRFEGDAFFPGGVQGCAARCASEPGLEMGSFIFAGEFSTACVCRVKASPTAVSEADAASAVGVVVQTRAAAAQQQQQQRR